jgi:hypothetical protein
MKTAAMRTVNGVLELHPGLRRSFTRKWVPVGRVDRGKAMIRVVIVQWHASPCGDHRYEGPRLPSDIQLAIDGRMRFRSPCRCCHVLLTFGELLVSATGLKFAYSQTPLP